jgi:repressor of nif and glnA expression
MIKNRAIRWEIRNLANKKLRRKAQELTGELTHVKG